MTEINKLDNNLITNDNLDKKNKIINDIFNEENNKENNKENNIENNIENNKNIKTDKFWSNNINILFQKNQLIEFFPSYEMTIIEKLNSIVRLSFYISILLFLFKGNALYLLIFFVVLMITFVIYKTQKKNLEMYFNSYDNLEKKKNIMLDNKKCIKPNINNPFMNYNIISDKKNRAEACKSWDNIKIKKDIKNNFNFNLYRDVSDLYEKGNSQRQFYTMPSTTMPNKQTEFAKWCYNTGPTCKEDTIKCTGPTTWVNNNISKITYLS